MKKLTLEDIAAQLYKLDNRFADFENNLDNELDKRFTKMENKLDQKFAEFEIRIEARTEKMVSDAMSILQEQINELKDLIASIQLQFANEFRVGHANHERRILYLEDSSGIRCKVK